MFNAENIEGKETRGNQMKLDLETNYDIIAALKNLQMVPCFSVRPCIVPDNDN